MGLRAWRRPTLPHLEVQYHRRRGVSRPRSGWDRVFGPSLWPPGRQGLAPPRLPVAETGAGGGLAGGGGGRRFGWGRPPRWGHGGSCRYARAASGSRPIERLVPVSCADYSASTSGLSTWWSSTALGETWF